MEDFLKNLDQEFGDGKVACRNLFGLMPKGETSYIVPKRRNAETAKPVKIAKLPKHAETSIIGFSIVSA
jgi:hypothetical protein